MPEVAANPLDRDGEAALDRALRRIDHIASRTERGFEIRIEDGHFLRVYFPL